MNLMCDIWLTEMKYSFRSHDTQIYHRESCGWCVWLSINREHELIEAEWCTYASINSSILVQIMACCLSPYFAHHWKMFKNTHTHTHTHIYIYTYINVYVYLCDELVSDESINNYSLTNMFSRNVTHPCAGMANWYIYIYVFAKCYTSLCWHGNLMRICFRHVFIYA